MRLEGLEAVRDRADHSRAEAVREGDEEEARRLEKERGRAVQELHARAVAREEADRRAEVTGTWPDLEFLDERA
jgi:hypothetical protein